MTAPEMNALKKSLRNGDACIGAWLLSNASINAEAMASLGFDWLCVDLEHGSSDISQIEAIFAATERHGTTPLVRISELDAKLGCRLLDMGAAGLIIAAVEDADAFLDFARACSFAPKGSRGVGLPRCNRWGGIFDDYRENFDPVFVPMIESRKGVEAAENLAALPMVDALFMGPYDLSSDLGKPGDMASQEIIDAKNRVYQACIANGKAAGIHQVGVDENELKARIDEGYRFVAYGADLIAIRDALAGVKNVKDKL